MIYSLQTDFGNDLKNHQLKNTINAAMTKTCTNVKVDEDVVEIIFDEELITSEETELDALVLSYNTVADLDITSADSFKINNIMTEFCRHQKATFTLTKNVKTQLPGGWTSVVGALPGFDNATGIWTCPSTGIYFYNLLISSTDNVGKNSDIHIEFQDRNNAFIFGTTNQLSIIHDPTYTFIGNGGAIIAGQQLKMFVEVDTMNMNMSCEFKIVRIIGA